MSRTQSRPLSNIRTYYELIDIKSGEVIWYGYDLKYIKGKITSRCNNRNSSRKPEEFVIQEYHISLHAWKQYHYLDKKIVQVTELTRALYL